MLSFPKVRIGDDVRAQHKLVTERFGIKSLALVVVGSMGAQQTYEWAVRYPDMVKRAAPIAGTARNTIHDFFSPRRWSRRSHRTRVSTGVSMNHRRMYEKVCFGTPKSGR